MLYAGEETKTQLNIKSPPKKTSRIEKKVNVYVVYILCFLVAIVSFSVLAHNLLSIDSSEDSVIESYISFTLLYNNITPISLFVTMDIIRILQVFFIQRLKKKQIKFKTGDINEDLGQVEYILTDKTGTLTENQLILQTCIIGNSKYTRENLYAYDHSYTMNDEEKSLYISTQSINESDNKDNSELLQTATSFSFQKLKYDLQTSGESSKFFEYLKCMALCNTIIPDIEKKSKFLGTSMDENALVETADELGIKLVSRSQDNCVAEINGTRECFQIIASSPFTSENKKSRILLKKQDNEYATLYVKGTCMEMMPLFHMSFQFKSEIEEQALSLQLIGQRTMILGFRILQKSEIKEFVSKLASCKNFPINREGRVEALYQEIESNLVYLGITGIDDIVTSETQETVINLHKAGIKL